MIKFWRSIYSNKALMIHFVMLQLVVCAAYATDPVQCTLQTDLNVKTIPTIPMPGYVSPIMDPTFNTRITRINDNYNQAIGSVGGTWGNVVRHHYSKSQAWNADQSILYIQRNLNGNPNGNVFVDGHTFKPLFTGKVAGEVRWDNNDANLMVYVNGSEVGKWNVHTKAVVWRKVFSAYSNLQLGPSEGQLSIDGKMIVVAGTRISDSKLVAFAYDMVNDVKYADIGTDYATTLDWASISPLAKYVVIHYNNTSTGNDQTRVFDLNGKLIQTWSEYGRPSHFDMTVDLDGVTELAVGVDKTVYSGRLIKRRLSDGVVTVLTKGGWVTHTSARNFKRPGWVYATIQADTSTTYPPYGQEILAVKLDGSVAQRIVNHRSDSVDYYSESHGSVSPDGLRVVFASNWHNPGGPVYDYVVELCPGMTSATPTPTPAPTATPTPTPSSMKFTAVADSYVSSGATSTNYGTATTLVADLSPTKTTYVKFNVANIPGTPKSAKVRLYVTNGSANGPYIMKTSTSWTETGVTYSNRPASSGSALDNKASISAGAWVEYNVLPAITGNGTYSFGLYSEGSDGVVFSSREGANPPQLLLGF